MKGWLVVNHFLESPKFEEIYEYLERAAEEQDILLERIDNVECRCHIDEVSLLDFVLFWDKDIDLCSELEEKGVRCFNPSNAIKTCDDKWLTFKALDGKPDISQPDTIPVPFSYGRGCAWEKTEFVQYAADRLGFPIVVKERHGSFGSQVSLSSTSEELTQALDALKGIPAICQEYISSSAGRDIRLQVIGNDVVAAMERHANGCDFRANITNGGSAFPFEPSAKQIKMAINAVNELQLDFAGVDLMFGYNGPVLCEVNSNAHFVNLSRISGRNIAADIAKLIKKECEHARLAHL